MQLSNVNETLYKALHDAQKPSTHQSKVNDLIDLVFDNTHLTYKYILLTALAAKATNGNINPLTLQAGSALPNAYDARSVCHGAIVKFEIKELGKALGGSNEPFLNKPARFPELSKNNAVRKGRDKQILHALCDNLPTVQTSEEAYDGLVYALQKLLIVKAERVSLTNFNIDATGTDGARLLCLVNILLSENIEGEILTLIVAGIYELYMGSIYDDYVVEVHPVNQSGASSKEVSDLDIYKNGTLFICNELKNKSFTEIDLRHAADKVIAAGQTHMHFIIGRSVVYDQDQIKNCIAEYLSMNFMINVIPVDFFVETLIGLIDSVDTEHFVKYILKTAIETKFKEETTAFIRKTVRELFRV